MIKYFLFMILLVTVTSIVRAQSDTTVYNGCKLATDDVIGDSAILDSCPTFGNGFKDVEKFITNHIHYPLAARKNRSEGKVIVMVIIEKDGRLTHAKVARKGSEYLDREALRVINSFPKWKPGILNKKPVRVRYALIVVFSLEHNS